MLDTAQLSVDGREIRYARHGDGPPMVCLHGYPETLQLYSALVPRLADTVESIPVDWPGLGQSDPLPGAPTPEARADQVIRLLDGLGIQRAFLFGTDMGGPPALIAAAKYPDRVRGVIVSNALLYANGPTSWELTLFRRFPVTNRVGLRYAPGFVFRRCETTFLPDGRELPSALRREFWRAFQRRAVRERLVEMCAAYNRTLARVPEWYAAVAVPTLVCWGACDRHFPPGQGQRLANQVAQATFEQVGGGAHWMVLHTPTRVARRIRSWVNGA